MPEPKKNLEKEVENTEVDKLTETCFTYYTYKIFLDRKWNLPPECPRGCDGKDVKCPFYEASGEISESKNKNSYLLEKE